MRVAALILAAGASTRLGEPKQLLHLGSLTGGATSDERLLERAIRIAVEARCSPVVVVLGAYAGEILEACHMEGVAVVRNEGWAEGMGSSVRVGMAAMPAEISGVVLMTCDQPAVTTEHLSSLIVLGDATGEAVGSAYAGRGGVPAFIPAGLFARLRALRGDEGARALITSARKVNLPGGELDVDTRESLKAAQQLFAH